MIACAVVAGLIVLVALVAWIAGRGRETPHALPVAQQNVEMPSPKPAEPPAPQPKPEPKPEPPPAAAHERQHLLREMKDGLRFVWREPRLRALALAGATRSFFGSFIGVLYGLYAIRELGLPQTPPKQALADAGPSPFVRQGYIFLGTSDRESILPMNNGDQQKKRVFQFHYRYPMIGGPAPIGTCLDELVEIAEGLFLGQLIYSTMPLTPFHTSVDPAEYKYQLFGYFLLMDNDWERHRQAIGFDVNTP